VEAVKLNDMNHLQQEQNIRLQEKLQQLRLTTESQQTSIQQLEESITQRDEELSIKGQLYKEEKAELEQTISVLEERKWWQVLFGR
jgi:hypothetical protein